MSFLRRITANAQPPPAPGASASTGVPFVVEARLVTPMFGGGAVAGNLAQVPAMGAQPRGATPGVADEDQPIRGPSVRGQLRFWWRLVRGSVLSAGELRQREAEIWGDTENPSPVRIRVEIDRNTLRFIPRKRQHNDKDEYGFNAFGPEAYALFSAKQNEVTRLVAPGLKFTLHLTWPSGVELQRLRNHVNKSRPDTEQLPLSVAPIDEDVKTAVAAWLKFGGLGGRTRRGVGAVHPEKPQGFAVPTNIGLMLGGEGYDDAQGAWGKGLDIYQWFRQRAFRNDGRRGSRRGRSRWPEPDSIRSITGCWTDEHSDPIDPQLTLPAFPKAVLGLPIVFKFADGPADEVAIPGRDPGRVTLNAHTGTTNGSPSGSRMASPVIIRPIWRVDLNKWVPGFIFLPRPEALQVQAYFAASPAIPSGEPILVPNEQIVGPGAQHSEPLAGFLDAISALKIFIRDALGQHPKFLERHT